MSRCAATRSLLDAQFAEIDLTRDQAAHLSACAECARAMALLRRFDRDLASVGRDLAPERAGSLHELIQVTVPKEGETVSWRTGFIGVAASAIVVLAVLGASALGERFAGTDIEGVFSQPLDRSEAAAAFALPENAVVMVGGDAVGLRVTGDATSARLELLLISAAQREVRQVFEQTVDLLPGGGGMSTQPVRCFDVLERDVYALIGMAWPAGRQRVGIIGASGETATFVVRDHGEEDRLVTLFVADAAEVNEDSNFALQNSGDAGGILATGPLMRGSVDCAQPGTAACRDWERWQPATRASLTEWLVETRLEAVRTSQQLRADATEREIVDAAVGSIDKNCQGSPPDTMLTDIVLRLYD